MSIPVSLVFLPFIIITYAPSIALGRTYDARRQIMGVAALAAVVALPVTVAAAVFAVVKLPLFAQITAVMVAHRLAAPDLVEEEKPVTGIIKIVVPAATKADIGKALPIVTIVIGIITAIRVASIAIVVKAVAGVAEADIINTARQTNARGDKYRRF